MEIAGPQLVASNVAENDYPTWSAAATYALGARVIKTATHRIYESAAADNIGNDPAGASGLWLDIGPTNRWAMFDQALGSLTEAAGAIVVTLNAGVAVNAIALLDVTAATVRVQATGYDRTKAPAAAPGMVSFLDMPETAGSVTVTISGAAVAVGTMLIGQLVGLGITEASPTAAITDYSRKETDAFGETTVVERAWAKRMSVKALLRTGALDTVAARIAAVRARPSLWIGDDGLESLTVYGFFKDYSIEVGEHVSALSLSVEGLSAADKLAPLTNVEVSWPDIKDDDPDHPKPADGATVGAPSWAPIGELTAENVIDALKSLALTFDPAEVVAGAQSMADAVKALTQSVNADELVANAKNLVDRLRAADMVALEQIILNQERKSRFDDLTHLDGIAVGARIREEITTRAEGDEALASQIVTLEAAVHTADAILAAMVETEQTARVNADEALASSITTLAVLMEDADTEIKALVVTESLARVAEDEALASQITALEASVESDVATLTASIDAETSARVSADAAETYARQLAISNLQTTVNGQINTVNAAIVSEASTRAAADEAEATTRSGQIATLTTNLNGEITNRQAAITAEATARAAADFAETTARNLAISTLQTDVDGQIATVTAGLESEASTRASADAAETEARELAISQVNFDIVSTQGLISAEATTRANADSAETAARNLAISTLTTYVDGEISDVSAAIASEATTRAAADLAETTTRTAQISTLTNGLTDANSAITGEATTRAAADLAETQARTAAVSTLTNGLSNANAAITSEANTRAATDLAETNARNIAISNLETDVEGQINTVSSAIADEAITRATADLAEASTRSGQIASLTTNLNGEISSREAAIIAEASARATAIAAETTSRNAAISSLRTELNGSISAAILNEATTRANADTAEVNARSAAVAALTDDLNDVSAMVSEETSARVAADLAETNTRSGQIATLTINLNGEIAAREAAIVAEASARATAIGAETTARNGAISSLRTELNGNIAAAILDEATTRASADAAEVLARTAAVASLSDDISDVSAMVVSETTARVNADSALANSISSVSTTVNGHTASITMLSSSIDGVMARWSLNLDSNDHVVGLIGGNNGETGGFDMVADYFRIWNASGTLGQSVFSFSGDTVRMQNVEVDTLRAGSGNSAQFGGRQAANDVFGVGIGTAITVLSKTVELLSPGAIHATAALAVAYNAGAKEGNYALYINGVNIFSVGGATTEISVMLAGYRVLPAGVYTVDVVFQGDTTMKVAGRNLSTTIVYAGKVRFDMPGVALAPDMSFSRASSATAYNVSGALVSVGNDVPRFNYDMVSHALLGLLIEPAVTNQVVNSGTGGAAIGVIGSGGALPTGWTMPEGAGGLTREVVGISTVAGFDVIDIRFYGAASVTSLMTLRPDNAGADAAAGQTWTNSVYLALIAGSLANVAGFQLRAGNETGSTGLSGLTSTLTRYANTRTLTSTSARQVLRWNYSATGAAVDFTLRVALPQRETGSVAHMPVKTSGAVATKAADAAALNWEGRNIPDSAILARYTFDNGSYQDVATNISGGVSTIPTTLNRPHLKSISSG